MGARETLLQIASPPLGPALRLDDADAYLAPWESAGRDLGRLLVERNGFYAFVSSLHVFPLSSHSGVMDLKHWNGHSLWRGAYGDLAEGCLFFAEDIFGGQFCLKDNAVHAFDPETGALEALGGTIDDWATRMLAEHDVLCGSSLAQRWQETHGPIAPGKRLAPKIPFVAGGEFALSNVYEADPVEALRFRAHLARQIRDLPEGAKIRFEVTD